EHLGPLLGPIGSCSTPVAGEIQPPDFSIIKLRAFVVTKHRIQPELRGCVFSRSEHVPQVRLAFEGAGVELTPIWNYNPSLFFDIPHYVPESAEENISEDHWLSTSRRLCTTVLKPHQLTALRFLRKNEDSGNNLTSLWDHPVNAWLRTAFNRSAEDKKEDSSKAQGSILADDMGLGKTLTTLAYIAATGDSAVEFLWSEWTDRSAATLPTVESLDLCWFRIVLDEAHLIRNPNAKRHQYIRELRSKFFLCLTGTPVQNRLTDLQSLITLFNIPPWSENELWRQHLVPHLSVGEPNAIRTLTKLMEAICLRRTKDVVLNLPPKVEKGIMVQQVSQWEEVSRELHQRFINDFGRLRLSGAHWDPAEFFRQLTRLRQSCNHPIFARSQILTEPIWR
ncbi:hypothetical protein PTTG_09102, partial [Puccinia triticina 1-1 BBBD Race 1]